MRPVARVQLGWLASYAIYFCIPLCGGLTNGVRNAPGFLLLGFVVVLFSTILLKYRPVFSMRLRVREAIIGIICIFLPYFVGGLANIVSPGFCGDPWVNSCATLYNGAACLFMGVLHSVACVTMNSSCRNIFISYSHKDKSWLGLVIGTLNPCLRKEVVVWDDSKIQPGGNWDSEIKKAIYTARGVVILMSPDFLLSEYIRTVELPAILSRRDPAILWVPVRAAAYEDTSLRPFQAVVDVKAPLADLPPGELERALTIIAQKVAECVGLPAKAETAYGLR